MDRLFRRNLSVGILVLLLAGLFAGLQISTWPVRLHYPGEQNDEGITFAEALHLRQGAPIYAPASPGRFEGSLYGPLCYLLGARLIDPRQPTYFPLRVVSMLGMLGCAAWSSLLAYKLSRRRCAAVLAAMVFLSYGFVTRFGTTARSDIVGVCLVFAGFVLAYHYFERRALFLAVPFMLLGLFYKQQFVAGPLAVILSLILAKQYRRAALFAGLLVLGALAFLGFFQFIAFPGQAFLSHFVLYNAVSFSWIHFKYVGLMHLGVVLLVPILLAFEFLRTHRNRTLLCYLSLSIVLSLVTAARVGSDSNYWFEPVLIVSALVAALVAERSEDPMKRSEVVLLFGISLFLARFFNPPAPVPRDFAADRAIQEHLRSHFAPGTPALTHYVGDLARAGLGLPISNFDQYRYLVAQGSLSDQELVDELERCRFEVIVLNYELHAGGNSKRSRSDIPESWARAILAQYRLAASLEMPGPLRIFPDDRFYVWVPRGSGAAPDNQPSR